MLKECPSCHSQFITSENHQYCKFCFRKHEEQKANERQKIENAKWLVQKEIENKQLEIDLKSWDVVDLDSIVPKTLCISSAMVLTCCTELNLLITISEILWERATILDGVWKLI